MSFCQRCKQRVVPLSRCVCETCVLADSLLFSLRIQTEPEANVTPMILDSPCERAGLPDSGYSLVLRVTVTARQALIEVASGLKTMCVLKNLSQQLQGVCLGR